MALFRKKTPKRRNVTKNVGHYSYHRKSLREDFNCRCGYCDSHDGFRRAHYEIDHFIPKDFLKEVFPVSEEYRKKEQEYSNLVYACQSCNNAKRKQWPTGSMDVHHSDNIGFVDPCKSEYADQFERNEYGEIIPKTKLGEWMYKTLRLWKPEHSIIWLLDELNQTICEIEEQIVYKTQQGKKKLEQKHYLLLLNYHKYHTQLMDC